MPSARHFEHVPGLGAFGRIAERAGRSGWPDHDRGWTVLAPVDAAFVRLGTGTSERIAACPRRAREFLARHVLPGRMEARTLARARAVTPMDGRTLPVASDSGAVRVGEAMLTRGDVEASSGVVHVIDEVLAA